MKNIFCTAVVITVATVAATLAVATPAKAAAELRELNGGDAILEVSCYSYLGGTVSAATVTIQDGTAMNYGTVDFSVFGWQQKRVSRTFEPGETAMIATDYGEMTGGTTASGVFEDVNGEIYSFSQVSVACTPLNLT